MRKIYTYFLFFVIFFSTSTRNLLAKERAILNKENSCLIYIKQTNKNLFTRINCTDKSKYPIPIIGYDKEHCIVLKRAFIFNGVNNKKFFKKGKGLYCAMDGFSDYPSWFYVQ